MAYAPVQDLWYPPIVSPSTGSMLIDATGEKAAFRGAVWWPGARTGTKDIRRVHFRFSTVSKAGGSALTVSLQNLSASTGYPDETQDETVAIANADSGFTSNAWYRTGTLSADRTVAFGEFLAVVIEFDGSGRLSSDSVRITFGPDYANASVSPALSPALKAGSWASGSTSAAGCMLLEFSDGSFGTIGGGRPWDTLQGNSAGSSSNPDEIGLKFTTGFNCKIDGAFFYGSLDDSSRDFDMVLYNGTTPIETVSYEAAFANHTFGTTNVIPFPETAIDGQTQYIMAIKPTSTNAVSYSYFTLNSSSHMAVWPGGTAAFWTQRTDGGAWSDTTAKRPLIGLRISAIDDGAGGGGGGSGGLLVHPGMSGGML